LNSKKRQSESPATTPPAKKRKYNKGGAQVLYVQSTVSDPPPVQRQPRRTKARVAAPVAPPIPDIAVNLTPQNVASLLDDAKRVFQNELDEVKKNYTDLKKTVTDLKSVTDLKKSNAEMKKENAEMKKEDKTNKKSIADCQKSLKVTQQEMSELKQRASEQNDDDPRLDVHAVQCNAKIENLRETVQTYNAKVDAISERKEGRTPRRSYHTLEPCTPSPSGSVTSRRLTSFTAPASTASRNVSAIA